MVACLMTWRESRQRMLVPKESVDSPPLMQLTLVTGILISGKTNASVQSQHSQAAFLASLLCLVMSLPAAFASAHNSRQLASSLSSKLRTRESANLLVLYKKCLGCVFRKGKPANSLHLTTPCIHLTSRFVLRGLRFLPPHSCMACSEEQLLAEDASLGKAAHSQASAAQQHANGNHSFMQYQKRDSQHDQGMLSSSAVPNNLHQSLTHQLPASFASMSTSFLSPDYGPSGQLQSSMQTGLNPHDSAWFREGQLASAQQQQQTLAWQQASHGLVHSHQIPGSPNIFQQVQHQVDRLIHNKRADASKSRP